MILPMNSIKYLRNNAILCNSPPPPENRDRGETETIHKETEMIKNQTETLDIKNKINEFGGSLEGFNSRLG